MLGRWWQTIFMAVMCGFAVLMVFSMIVAGYGGGPARPFANSVVRATTSDLEGALSGPVIWLERHL